MSSVSTAHQSVLLYPVSKVLQHNSCVQASDQELEAGGEGLRQRRARGSKSNLLGGAGRQSSAVNLTGLGRDSDLKRLIEEVIPHLLLRAHHRFIAVSLLPRKLQPAYLLPQLRPLVLQQHSFVALRCHCHLQVGLTV